MSSAKPNEPAPNEQRNDAEFYKHLYLKEREWSGLWFRILAGEAVVSVVIILWLLYR